MHASLLQNEVVVREGAANLQRGPETVGGKLYLTTERLVFEAHQFNIQTGTTEIRRSEIASVEKCWTKFLNLLPLLPNSILVRTANAEFRLVVSGGDAWIRALTSR